jgi:glucose/mannose-6-phosphate isomerase
MPAAPDGASPLPDVELDPALVVRLDPSGQFAAAGDLGGQLRRGWDEAVVALDGVSVLDRGQGPVDGVIVCGVGGSAIGGDVVRACVVDTLTVPFEVVRGYDLPAWASPRTLVVGVSYSGDTEETLSCTRGALASECRVVGVASGGALAALARERDFPLVPVSGGLQPRAALGYLVASLAALLERVGLVDGFGGQVVEASELAGRLAAELAPGVPEPDNVAKRLARRLYGRVALIYGAALAAPAARRWKAQINENANAAAFYGELPEVNHNESSGWTADPAVSSDLYVVLLEDRLAGAPLRRRAALTRELMSAYAAGVDLVESRGESPLARLISLSTVGDHASLYLALLYGIDPATVDAITWLKRRMAGEELPPPSRDGTAATGRVPAGRVSTDAAGGEVGRA